MSTRRRYRGRLHNGTLLACSLGLALLGASYWFVDSTLGGRVLGTILLVLWSAVAVRIVRSGVLPAQDCVIVRGVFRTRRLPWTEIRGFGTNEGESVVPWRLLTVSRKGGETLRVGEVSSLALGRDGNYVEKVAEELNRELNSRARNSRSY